MTLPPALSMTQEKLRLSTLVPSLRATTVSSLIVIRPGTSTLPDNTFEWRKEEMVCKAKILTHLLKSKVRASSYLLVNLLYLLINWNCTLYIHSRWSLMFRGWSASWLPNTLGPCLLSHFCTCCSFGLKCPSPFTLPTDVPVILQCSAKIL